MSRQWDRVQDGADRGGVIASKHRTRGRSRSISATRDASVGRVRWECWPAVRAVRAVSRVAAVVHNGVMILVVNGDAVSYGAAVGGATHVSQPAPSGVLCEWVPGCARLWGGRSHVDAEAVGS